MAKKRRRTRKELLKEPDEFITFSSKLITFATEHKTHLTYTVGIIAALAVIISGIRLFSIWSENNAAALLDKTLSEYNSIKANRTAGEVFSEVSKDFQLILQKYGGTNTGKIAQLIYANLCYDAGQYEQAIDLYKASLTEFEKHPLIYNQILSNLGYAYEQKKDFSTAAGYFEKIASIQDATIRDEALYNLGRLYDQLGQIEKSREAYGKVLSDYQDFIYIELVKERLSG
jgi:tetratricopeptide (TPR) repeat protein